MIRDPRRDDAEETAGDATSDPQTNPPQDDELDLDLEEIGDSDRLKEGFTGQER